MMIRNRVSRDRSSAALCKTSQFILIIAVSNKCILVKFFLQLGCELVLVYNDAVVVIISVLLWLRLRWRAKCRIKFTNSAAVLSLRVLLYLIIIIFLSRWLSSITATAATLLVPIRCVLLPRQWATHQMSAGVGLSLSQRSRHTQSLSRHLLPHHSLLSLNTFAYRRSLDSHGGGTVSAFRQTACSLFFHHFKQMRYCYAMLTAVLLCLETVSSAMTGVCSGLWLNKNSW